MVAKHCCACGCGQHPANHQAEYVRGHRPHTVKLCRVIECDRHVNPHGAFDLCKYHYDQFRAYLRRKQNPPITAIERFMRNVIQVNECWIWKGSCDGSGYGMFSDRSRSKWLMRSHRWSYEYFVSDIPDGLELDHLCHTNDANCAGGVSCPHRRCVNPWHLEPVTKEENARRSNKPKRSSCPHGHEYSTENTYINKLGRQVCRTCAKRSQQRYEQRRKVA